MGKWLEVLEGNREKILEGMETAYKDAAASGFAMKGITPSWYGFEVSISLTGEVETYRIDLSALDAEVRNGKTYKIQRYSCWNLGDMEGDMEGETPEDRIADEWEFCGREAAELHLDHLIAEESEIESA